MDTTSEAALDVVRILVVDDQPAHLISYEAILRDERRTIVCARSGVEALQHVMQHEFAAILLDVNMPGMDGFELATLIHQHPRFEETPIIFVTAMHMSDLDRLKGYELGAIDYIYVPVIPKILRSKVDVLVELYLKRRELQRLNRHLEQANIELAQANSLLQAEKTQELTRLNETLEATNQSLIRANERLQSEVLERSRAEVELARTKDGLALQVESLTRIHELAMYLAGAHDLPSAMEFVLRTVVEAHGAPCGVLCLYDEASGELAERARFGYDDSPASARARELLRSPQGPCGASFASGKRVIVPDVEGAARFGEYGPAARALGLQAEHSTPIVTRSGERRGVISVQFALSCKPTEREMQIADMCARYAAETIEAAIYQESLRTSEQRLREADQRKDEFLAALAHELRNPLAPILNSLHVLRMRSDADADFQPVLGIFERQVNQVVRLVDDLLDVSRITRDKINLALETIDLAAVLRLALETNAPHMQAAQHELSLRVPAGPIAVEVDPVRLCQVFANLLDNAAKFTPRGGHIELAVEPREHEVVVSVRDDGVGIPLDMQARVFDMFTQIDRTLNRAQGGLGVGLTLVKRLVEMHHGRVEVRSAGRGQGSEFRVTLPLARASAHESAPRAARAGAGGAPRRLDRRVLIVDDNQDAASMLELLLRGHGAQVRVAHGGREALELIPEYEPEIVLLDLGMPGLNGYEVAQRIREDPAQRPVMLVALTGWGQPEDRVRSKACGIDHHLVKPVEIDQLAAIFATDVAPRARI
jgi:signal transduction histidine kinase/DNA-binding response OmpR family regulator